MSQSAAQLLEFQQVVELVRRYASSPLGLAQIERLRPGDDRATVEQELAQTAEALEYLRGAEPELPFRGLHDVRPACGRLGIEGALLEPLEIFHLLGLLEQCGDICAVLGAGRGRYPRLAGLGDGPADFRPLVRELAGKILPTGELDDQASPLLRRLRREIAGQRRAVHESLERFVRAHSEEGSLQEDYVTIRNERLVVPVKAGQKRRIEGVIHAASSTGHTLFVEPLETIELNNQLVRLADEEAAEVRRILRQMTARLAGEREAIAAAIDTLARLECLFALGRYGLEFGAAIPVFSPPGAPRLALRQARHPLLEDLLRRRGAAAVPASIQMDSDRRVLIITGPNTGGKTVALKTVGLLALMARAGLPTPAESAEFPWFDQVLADIGDSQSIQDSLSTFSAHLTAIRAMIEQATAHSLVLIDELGAATDPQEGGALGVAIVDHFRRAGSFTVVSTHLPALKVYGARSPGVLSAAVGFNEDTLEPNYRLTIGLPGKSAGLDIAQRLGIRAEIIEEARRSLSGQDVEAAELLRELHRRLEQQAAAEATLDQERRELAGREKQLEREWEKRQTAKLRELERRMETAIARFDAQAREAIEKIGEAGGRRAVVAASRGAARLEREMRQEFETAVAETLEVRRPAPPLARLQPGSLVRLRSAAAPARVLRLLAAGRVEVQAGAIKMQVSLEEVAEVVPAGAPAAARPEGVRFQTASRPEGSLTEINVIGATAEEARERVDKFLDSAVVAALLRVRVIHGHGMGVLRKTLWQMFAGHPHVEKYYQAEQREGGAGATIVELKP